MQQDESPVTSDLVLIGGGHSHLFVLKHFAMHSLPGVRITLVTRDLHTPYSGMLPGFIAGHYDYDDAHIDLLPLARYAGARVIHDEVCAIDTERKPVSLNRRPALDYDLLSINIGSRPFMPHAEAAVKNQFAVKPVDRFINSWHQLEQALQDNDSDLRLARRGIASSLQPQNIRIRHSIQDTHKLASEAAYPLLFDPQTAGGLLAGVARQYAEPCLQQLRDLGYQHAQIVARVTQASVSERNIRLVHS